MSDSNSKLDKIDAKIDRIQEKISSIDVTLAGQHEQLKLHIKRTNLLEKKLEPVERHVTSVNALLKVIMYMAAVAAIVEGIIQVFHVK